MDNICSTVYQITNDIITNLGYEIVDIEYKKMYGENNLTIFIFKKGGVGLNDCEKVSQAIDLLLDESDFSKGEAYNLNISSPGLDRLIISSDDYRRGLDTEIEVIFDKPKGKKKKAIGVLVSYDNDTLTLNSGDKVSTFNKSDLKTVRPYIKF